METTHRPTLITKAASGYVTDEGQHVAPHTLHRYECSCGWKGQASYANPAKAGAHYDRHTQ